jgi:hypothetical protein
MDPNELHNKSAPQGGDGLVEELQIPGASWKNPKAQQEMAKAMEAIVDKDLMIGRELTGLLCVNWGGAKWADESIGKYGDVMDPRRGGPKVS